MVKSYLRYTQEDVLGLVAQCAGTAAIAYARGGKWAVAAALEACLVWDIRKGTLVFELREGDAEVTAIAVSLSGAALAAGYADGALRLWALETGVCTTVLNGHSAAVTALGFTADGALLASGSADADIVVWDLLSETGLSRLRGHKSAITSLLFVAPVAAVASAGASQPVLISASKDTLVKMWDLAAQASISTLVGHRAEVWALAVNADATRLVAGSVDAALRVWDLSPLAAARDHELDATARAAGVAGHVTDFDLTDPLAAPLADRFAARAMGHIGRESSDRVANLAFSASGEFLLVQGAEKVVQLFRVRGADEQAKRARRRLKRQRERATARAATGAGDTAEAEPAADRADGSGDEPEVGDELAPALVIRTKERVRSAALCMDGGATRSGADRFTVLLALANNVIEEHAVSVTRDESGVAVAMEHTKVAVLEREGHRSDVRALALASTDDLAVAGTNGAIKVWALRSGQVVRTLDAGYVLALAVAPGDRHVLAGTKDGTIEIFDLRSGEATERLQAHVGAVWGIAIAPDGRTVVSVSADKEARFWDLEFAPTSLSLIHTRTLKMSDDVLAVSFSPDGKFVALALLDATVKVFFTDTLRFFVSLYGHKLPVLALAFSSDCALIATGSADKNLKLWGADFGDCRKSLFAHDDSVMALAWVRNTHYLFTAGKDGRVKYWDCDTFELIQVLPGHHAEVWSLAVSSLGDFIVTGSHDRSARVFRRTEEQLFIEEELEARNERDMAAEIAAESARRPFGADDGGGDEVTGSTALRSLETLKAGERLLEAITLAVAESATDAVSTDPSPLLLGLSPSQHMLRVLRGIRPSELDEALIVLPFTAVYHLFSFALEWARDGPDTELELAARVVFALVRMHMTRIAANQGLRLVVAQLRESLDARLTAARDLIALNVAALAHVAKDAQHARTVTFADAAPVPQFAEVTRLS